MACIAHITDLHLVEETYRQRSLGARLRLQWLNSGRTIDPQTRRQRVVSALRSARGSDHVLITGDLTEDGVPAQFELLAELLAEAGLSPERVTLIAGNHDLYTDATAFTRALAGPLWPYARSSMPGELIDLGHTLLLPIDTAVQKPLTRSSGVFRPERAQQIDALLSDPGLRGRTLLVAQHHPPLGYSNPLWNFLDGIDNVPAFSKLLFAHERLHVLHGHTHGHVSRALHGDRSAQIHSAGAVLDDPEHVRFYQTHPDGLSADSTPQPPAGWLTPGAIGARPRLA